LGSVSCAVPDGTAGIEAVATERYSDDGKVFLAVATGGTRRRGRHHDRPKHGDPCVLPLRRGLRQTRTISEQVAALNVEDNVLDPMPRSALSFAFLASSEATYFTAISMAQRVAR
jgi:hypothetical protein